MYGSALRAFAGFGRFVPVLQDEQKHNRVLSAVLSNEAFKKFQLNNFYIGANRQIPDLQPPKNNYFLTSEQCRLLDNKKITIIEHKGQNKSYQINAIQYQANNSIQDRLVVSSLKTIKAEIISVFDGHGGDKLSDYCANHIIQVLDGFLEKNKNKQKYVNDEDKLIYDGLKYSYEKIDKDFYQNVYQTLVTVNYKKIRGIGTCALTVVIYNNKIYVANSGDSEAIAVCKRQDNQIYYIQLNQRFSVNNPVEKQRLKKQFPNDQDIIVQQKSGCCYLKGRLQPTRALGDYHLKYSHLFKGKGDFNGPYITCQPDIKIFPICGDFQTIVVASDGVWDFLKKNKVAEASLQENPHQKILQNALKRVAELHKRSVNQIKQICAENKRSYHDDISIAVVNLLPLSKTIAVFQRI